MAGLEYGELGPWPALSWPGLQWAGASWPVARTAGREHSQLVSSENDRSQAQLVLT